MPESFEVLLNYNVLILDKNKGTKDIDNNIAEDDYILDISGDHNQIY